MGILENFSALFLEVWKKGILGVDIFQILIGLGIFLIFLLFSFIFTFLMDLFFYLNSLINLFYPLLF